MGITVTLALDARDHLLVALESSCYNVQGVTVSLRLQTPEGVTAALSVTTDQQGQADFGSIHRIHKPEHNEYLLVIKGLTESSKSSDREEGIMLSLENFQKAQAFFQEHHKRLLKS